MKRLTVVLLVACAAFAQNKVAPEKEAAMKADLAGQIDGMKKQAQVMVDSVFSFGELGFQEFETSKYLIEHPRKRRLQSPAQYRRNSHGVRRDAGAKASR